MRVKQTKITPQEGQRKAAAWLAYLIRSEASRKGKPCLLAFGALLLMVLVAAANPAGYFAGLMDTRLRLATASVPWTPADLGTNLVLWLDASDASTLWETTNAITAATNGGLVARWDSKASGGAIAYTAGNPTYSTNGLSTGKQAVLLDGTGDYGTATLSGIASYTALDVTMVMQTTAAAAADTSTALFYGYGNQGAASGPYPQAQGTSLASSSGATAGEKIIFLYENVLLGRGTGRIGSSSYARAANTAQLLYSSGSASGYALFTNGVSVGLTLTNEITTATAVSPSVIAYTVDSSFHIGAFRASGTISATPAMRISETLVSRTVLSTTDRQKLEGYLAHKWGMAANLPSDHPYKSAAPIK